MRRSCWQDHLLPEFNPEDVEVSLVDSVSWTDLSGKPSPPPDYGLLPNPEDVLSGDILPDFENLRCRDDKTFVAGELKRFFPQWEQCFHETQGFSSIRKWLEEGVDFYEFFTHYKGVYKGRSFDSSVPPPMFFPNAPICYQYESFVTEAILKGVKQGSMRCVRRIGTDPPPRVLNALSVSVEPTKNRLILSMKGVNLFCGDTPFKLHPLSEVVKGVKPGGFFSSLDDVQGYKQLPLKPNSWEFCGFQWGGFFFVDTCLSFGWKNSAYVYTLTGRVISEWLRRRGVHTSLWIDDRFIGQVE